MEHYFKKAKFITSLTDVSNAPNPRLDEVLFVGKSNVGKSSLINALVNQKNMAFTSKKPGHTRLLNYFLIDDSFYFVDAPGYGYSAKKDVDYAFYGDMLENYFKDNAHLKLIVFLLDSRHMPTDDDYDFYKFLTSFDYPYVVCMTKCDKLNQSEKSKIYKNLNEKFDNEAHNLLILLSSVSDKRSILLVKEAILNYVNKGE